MKIIAKTFAGLEELLAKELETIGAQDIEQGIRMVSFTGDKETLYRANFCLRTAVKVLMRMAGGERLIGIISHVTELKQEIENQLIVEKGDEGSTVRWQIS